MEVRFDQIRSGEVAGARNRIRALLFAGVCLLFTVYCSPVLAQMGAYKAGSPLYGPRPELGSTTRGLPPMLRDVRIEQKLNEQVPLDLQFRDETGRTVQLREYFGKKPVALVLVFYQCPMLCNQIMGGLTTAMKVMSFNAGKEFDVVTVSFDPRETPQMAAEKKKFYVERYGRPGTDGGLHFLVGDAEPIRKLTDAVGFRYGYDEKTDQFAHASGIMLLTPEGRVSRYFYGIEYSPRDLRLGLVEASANKIGSPVDQLLLYCFHYDPASGTYGAAILNLVRLAGVVTVLAILSMIIFLRRPRVNREGVHAGGSA